MPKAKASEALSDYLVDKETGIRIPLDLTNNMAPIADFAKNPWNPNHMDAFMAEKLDRSIKTDGYLIPLLVRPNPDSEGPPWQIIDGEHRWTRGGALGMKEIPFTNLGPISDAAAMALTVKANSLHGDYDSVELARLVKSLAGDGGLSEVAADLPFSLDRLTSMVDLLETNITTLSPDADKSDEGEKDEDGKPRAASDKSFKSFDPTDMKFEHECPRCGFGFNPSEKAGLGTPKS